eukprot:jgi/Botrbrau1/2739/Bobra.0164s0019.1
MRGSPDAAVAAADLGPQGGPRAEALLLLALLCGSGGTPGTPKHVAEALLKLSLPRKRYFQGEPAGPKGAEEPEEDDLAATTCSCGGYIIPHTAEQLQQLAQNLDAGSRLLYRHAALVGISALPEQDLRIALDGRGITEVLLDVCAGRPAQAPARAGGALADPLPFLLGLAGARKGLPCGAEPRACAGPGAKDAGS